MCYGKESRAFYWRLRRGPVGADAWTRNNASASDAGVRAREDRFMKTLASEISIRDFLAAVASAEGAHGAVSAAAVAGGVGVSLLAMVAALPKTRSDSADERMELMKAQPREEIGQPD
jgi:hypothetical protein